MGVKGTLGYLELVVAAMKAELLYPDKKGMFKGYEMIAIRREGDGKESRFKLVVYVDKVESRCWKEVRARFGENGFMGYPVECSVLRRDMGDLRTLIGPGVR